MTKTTPLSLPGYRGEITSLEIIAESVPESIEPTTRLALPRDISLREMAQGAMHYLTHNPLPGRDYACRFDISLLHLPPSMYPGSRDPHITFGDTEARMDWEFIYMRDMTGSAEGQEVERAIHQRLLSYVREDGLCWLVPYSLNCDDIESRKRQGKPPSPPCALPWTTDKLLMSLAERYARNGNQRAIELAQKLVRGLESIANWDTGRAYYAGGMGGWRDGDWFTTGYSDNYPCILEPIARYVEVTADQRALAFAQAFADGTIADLQVNLGDNRILNDGSFGRANCHVHMRATLGIIHLGVLTRNTRYVEWGRRVYEFMISQGADWGWFPESVGRSNSETCATGDMADCAAWLAKAGYTRYWDDLERFVRNYLREAQFFVTPEYETRYLQLHSERSTQEIEAGLADARNFEGGFIARLTPNSLMTGNRLSMMGCCPPEGMRALHIAWRNVVTETPEGCFVNLSFSRDAPQARVVSFAPHIGRLSAIVKEPGNFFLRPPSWTRRAQVKAYRETNQIEPHWKGDYIAFASANEGEELTITFPVLSFRQTVDIRDRTYAYSWIGNTVMSVSPPAPDFPLFATQLA